jgi:Co/Zn/Cd efflux system component
MRARRRREMLGCFIAAALVTVAFAVVLIEALWRLLD